MVMQFFAAKAERERGVELFGTPNFLFTFAAIAAGAFQHIDLQEDIRRTAKYLPIKTCVFTNHSAEDIDLEINGIPYTLVPAGVITTITESIWTLRATNNDAGITGAGLIRANFKTAPLGVDEAVRDAFRRRTR